MLLLNLGHGETTACRERKEAQVRKTETAAWLLQSTADRKVPRDISLLPDSNVQSSAGLLPSYPKCSPDPTPL